MGELGPSGPVPMTFELLTDADGSVVIRIAGELDITTVDELDVALRPALGGRPERLVVDLADVRFADSSAIAQWVKWAGAVGTLEIRNPSPLLRAVIARMGLAETLRVDP